MALNRAFQDEINASEAIKAAERDKRNREALERANRKIETLKQTQPDFDSAQGITSQGTPVRVTQGMPDPIPAPKPPPPPTYNTGTTTTQVAADDVGKRLEDQKERAETAADNGGDREPTSYFDLNEIRAALEAIAAQFELERGDLNSRKSALARAMELLMGRLGREETRSLRESKARSSGSGRIRSGLFLRDQAEIAETFAAQRARAASERDAQLSPIQRALSTLNARREAAQAAEARRIAREQAATQAEIARALELI